jgi:release factor glutamine methyltransferase
VPSTACCSTRFGPLEIAYDDRVLEPRDWTLLQSRWAAELDLELPEGRMLELCAGAGQIGLAAIAITGRQLVQVDLNPVACEFAESNARAAGLDALVETRCGDLADVGSDGEQFAVVLADPPYVPTEQVADLPGDPVIAVDGGPDGLHLLRACLGVIERVLAPHGAALVQVLGDEQARALTAALPDGLELVEVRSHDDRRAVAHLRWAEDARGSTEGQEQLHR